MKPEHQLLRSDDEAEPAKQIVLRLHDLLVRELIERYGESLRVEEADCGFEGNTRYVFDERGFRCTAEANGLNDQAGSIEISIRLGRLYKGYSQALRWLVCNRDGNSVAFSCNEGTHQRHELWVAANRVTLPDDQQGIREMLADLRVELTRLNLSLGCLFPQMVEGAALAYFEEGIREEAMQPEQPQSMVAILSNPQSLIDVAEADPDFMAQHWYMVITVAGWLNHWDKQLDWIDFVLNANGDNQPTPEQKLTLLGMKLGALFWLRRYEECLLLADQSEKDLVEAQRISLGTVRGGALYGLGRSEEVLEALRSATFDGNPRAWYWRSLAHARLGQQEEAVKAFVMYERGIGPDIIGRKKLRDGLPPEDSDYAI